MTTALVRQRVAELRRRYDHLNYRIATDTARDDVERFEKHLAAIKRERDAMRWALQELGDKYDLSAPLEEDEPDHEDLDDDAPESRP